MQAQPPAPPGTGCGKQIVILDKIYQDFTPSTIICGFTLAIKASGFIQGFNIVNPQGTTAPPASVGSALGCRGGFPGQGVGQYSWGGTCASLERLLEKAGDAAVARCPPFRDERWHLVSDAHHPRFQLPFSRTSLRWYLFVDAEAIRG